MKKENKEIAKLTVKEILLSLCDLAAVIYFAPDPFKKKEMNSYSCWRGQGRDKLMEKIYYLRRYGYIETFIQNKKKYLKLTDKGKKKVINTSLEKIKIRRTKNWDGKFRIIVFDIPEYQKKERDLFRSILRHLNFYPIQKSVYAYPFNCHDQIRAISRIIDVEKYAVIVMVAEVIQGERKIIENFIDLGILRKKDINQDL